MTGGKKKSGLLEREIHRVLPSRISLKSLGEKILRGFGGRESQFFICSGDVAVMKRNETAAAMARCPLVPQSWNGAKKNKKNPMP